MKVLFAILTGLLGIASMATWWAYPTPPTDVPVLYWVTDLNPARVEQIRIFMDWQIKNGHHTTETIGTLEELASFRQRRFAPAVRDTIVRANPAAAAIWDERKTALVLSLTVHIPKLEMRTDAANSDVSKKIIQGVTGIGGDVMDLGSGSMVRQFQEMGLLEDVTDTAAAMGFGLDRTWPALTPELSLVNADGERRQYAFPCNVNASLLWFNKETFERYGQPLPPAQWTIAEFEARGKAFVAAANPPGQRNTVFFADGIPLDVLHRSKGLSQFNETLTRCTIDDPRWAESMRLIHKWTYADRLLPTQADRASFATDSGYGGATAQLFFRGNFAMMHTGRYLLIQFRKFGTMSLGVAGLPYDSFPNAVVVTRCAGIYYGGPNKELAALFTTFLASEDYNMQIVRDADALPPDPKYTLTEAYLRPPDFPNEWGSHEVFAEAVRTIAIAPDHSPFVQSSIVNRHLNDAQGAVMNDRLSAEEAAAQAVTRIHKEIDYTLAERPELAAQYEQRVRDQQTIDALRAAGKPVPASLIHNTFYRRYYQQMGWLEEDR